MANQRKAYAYGLATVLLWSTVASAFKISLRHLTALQLLLLASFFSSVALLGLLVVQGKLRLLRSCGGRALRRAAALGLLNPFLYYVVLFQAYHRLPAQEAQPLNYTWAITLSLLSVPLLGQRLSRWDLVALVVSYAGVVVLATRGDLTGLRFSDPVGVALALGSTVLWSLYWIENTRDRGDPVVALWLHFVFGFGYTLALCALAGELAVPSLAGVAGAAYVGFFEMGLTFALWLAALRHAESAARVSSLIFLSPFLSLLLIHHLVGEAIRSATWVGLALIVAGLALQRIGREDDRRQVR